jgi:hypothetical protein
MGISTLFAFDFDGDPFDSTIRFDSINPPIPLKKTLANHSMTRFHRTVNSGAVRTETRVPGTSPAALKD